MSTTSATLPLRMRASQLAAASAIVAWQVLEHLDEAHHGQLARRARSARTPAVAHRVAADARRARYGRASRRARARRPPRAGRRRLLRRRTGSHARCTPAGARPGERGQRPLDVARRSAAPRRAPRAPPRPSRRPAPRPARPRGSSRTRAAAARPLGASSGMRSTNCSSASGAGGERREDPRPRAVGRTRRSPLPRSSER